MPIDEDGNRADIVMDPNSTINRANPGRLYEQYFNASARDTHKRLCERLGIERGTKAHKALKQIHNLDISKEWDYLMGFYELISPVQRSWFNDGKISGTHHEYLAEIIEKGVTIYFPTNNQVMSQNVVVQMENSGYENYKPLYGKVSYVGNSGKRCTTVKNIRIAPVYIVLLEKTGDDWGAVSSGKLQHHGVLSQLTRNDKYSQPARNQPVRGIGEAEGRIFVSYCGSRFLAEQMDRNNNPLTHRVIVENILTANNPTNIDCLVDRKVYPFGGAKPLQIVKHLLQTSGVDFEFTPYATAGEHYRVASITSNRDATSEEV